MSDFLRTELLRWRSWARRTWLSRGFNAFPDWVFPNRAGNMMDLANLKQRHYKTIIKEAGLRYIPFHCLRDTFATLLLMANTPLSYISQQLGHQDPKITVQHYAQWLPGSNNTAMNALPRPEAEVPESSATA